MIIKNVIIYALKRVVTKVIENILLLKQTYREKWIELLIEFVDFMLFDDQFAINIRNELIIHDENTMIHWKNYDKILWFDDKLYLFKQLRNLILISNHNDLLIDHFKIKKNLKFMQRKYY